MGLSERARMGRSPIHGKGVFAIKRIRSEAYIGTFEGLETTRDGTHVLWVIDDDGCEVGIEGRNVLRFLNHSKRPNAEFRGADLHAIRNIQPGHEITFDYGEGWDDVD